MLLNVVNNDPAFNTRVHLAARSDNPFQPANFAYGLTIETGDDGADAIITFTLTGANGSASTFVNTELIKRMEKNDTNFVTLQSPDLGALQSITVQSSMTGKGRSGC
jgi:hypothetical protein